MSSEVRNLVLKVGLMPAAHTMGMSGLTIACVAARVHVAVDTIDRVAGLLSRKASGPLPAEVAEQVA